MDFLRLLLNNPIQFIILAVVLLYSIILHEIAHGWVALLFGDDTAKRYGRLTLNPIPHIDIIGVLMLFIVHFGWAKPVPVNYYTLKNTRFGMIAVALAGCLTNIGIAIIAVFILQITSAPAHSAMSQILTFVAQINIILGSFNLIPIPPLDGSKIVMWFLPENAQENLARLEPYGFFILAFFLFTGLLNPVIGLMYRMVSGVIASIVGLFA